MFSHFNTLIKIVIIIFISIFFLLFSALSYFSSGLPDYKKLETYEPPVSSRVYANNGDLIAEGHLDWDRELLSIFDEGPRKALPVISGSHGEVSARSDRSHLYVLF